MNETIFENIGFFLNQEDLKIGASEPVSFSEDEHFQLDVIDLPLHFKCDAEKDSIVCRLYQRRQFGISEENPICTIRFSADGSEVMGEECDENSVFRFGTADDTGESGNVAMARVFLRTASFLRRYSIENHLVDEWEYYDAETDGILVKSKEDGTIQLRLVSGKKRPSLMGTSLFGGMEMCRPYWDEMLDSMMGKSDSFEELLEEAEDGDEDAMIKVANAYYNGNDFDEAEEDKEKALFWYRKLADMGNSTAQFNLGIMYMKGEAVPQSLLIRWR